MASASFKKLNTKIYSKKKGIECSDSTYWNKFGVPVLVKEFGPIDYINFSPIEPYYFAVTSSVRVQIYNPITKLVVKNFPRYRENAYGATFRDDGKLLCTGGDEKVVKLYNVQTKALVRLFRGHTAPVHRTFFIPDKPQIVSFSDDKSVKIWDIPTEKSVTEFSDHTDYIRAGAITPVLSDMVLSGSYDKTVKMYDTRTNNTVLTVDHGSPVESVLFLPSGGIFLSAGGTDIKVWNLLAGGKLIGNISQHHKTITCLHLASDNKRLFSGSLDRHVKIYDTSNYKVVHTIDYPNAVLSLGVSKSDDTIVAGLVDGLISVKRREENVPKNTQREVVSYKYKAKTNAKVDDVVRNDRRPPQPKYDYCLQKFKYLKALLCTLPHSKKSPASLVEVMNELIRRKALARVFEACEDKVVLELLKFFVRNISDYRFTCIIINAANIFIDAQQPYINNMPDEIKYEFRKLNKMVQEQLALYKELASLQGALDMILASSKMADYVSLDSKTMENLVASNEAQKIPILSVT